MNQEEQSKKEMIATKIMLLHMRVDELEFELLMTKSQLKEERFNRIVLSVALFFLIIVTSLSLTL